MIWEESSGYLFGKSLFFLIWIVDRHFQNCLLEALKFRVRVSSNEERCPMLKALGRQTGYVWSLVQFLLHKMMLTAEISVHAGDGCLLVIKDSCTAVSLSSSFFARSDCILLDQG